MRKFKVYNYDISLKIVMFLQHYNRYYGVKFKITSSALNRLDKFFTILAKIIFLNSCLISLNNHRSSVFYWTTRHVTEIVLRGYEINVSRFKQDYDQITNPINDLGKSSFETHTSYGSRGYDYSHEFKEPLDQILNEVINIYGEDQTHKIKITKGEQDLPGTIVSILLCILDTCVLPIKMEKGKEYIINHELLCKVADLEDIIKIDNVLGGNDILKFDVPQFENMVFEEIRIDDLTDDDIEKKLNGNDKHKIRYKGYPIELDELVID